MFLFMVGNRFLIKLVIMVYIKRRLRERKQEKIERGIKRNKGLKWMIITGEVGEEIIEYLEKERKESTLGKKVFTVRTAAFICVRNSMYD